MAITRDELLKYLGKKTRKDLSEITDDTELFSSGLIDSFAMVDLLNWLEKKNGVRFDYGNITLETVDSVGRILEFAAKNSR